MRRTTLCYLAISLKLWHWTLAFGVYSTPKPTISRRHHHQRSVCLATSPSTNSAVEQQRHDETSSHVPIAQQQQQPTSPFVVSGVGDDAAVEQQQQQRARDFLKSFETAWNSQSTSAEQIVQDFFIADDSSLQSSLHRPFWRDMVAFTWNIGTHEGSESITQAIKAVSSSLGGCNSAGPSTSLRQESTRPVTRWTLASRPMPVQANDKGGLEFWCDLKVDSVGTGKAHFRITPSLNNNNNHQEKIQTLLTTLLDLSDRPFQVGANRIRGQRHGPIRNRMYWPEQLQEQQQQYQKDDEHNNNFCVIIGGGQAGLALGARLHLMSIPYIILEAGSQPGMAWRKRYPSLHLHDPVWYNHMPYLPFPETWPMLCPRDKIADWLQVYAKVLDLNVQTNSRVTRVVKNNGLWEVHVKNNDAATTTSSPSSSSSSSHENNDNAPKQMFRAKHVVFATGNSSKPRVPKVPGIFSGIQLHSSQYQGGRPFANKRVVVIGSNNSGFDIAQDLWEQGAKSVTMIQRSPSMVVSTESVLQHGLGPLYRQDAPLHHEEADLVATSTPYKLLIPRWKAINQQMQQTDQVLHQNLVDAGYQLDFGPDGTGIFAKSATEGGGFYIDMGCAELLIRGDVMIRYATVSRFEHDQVVILDKQSQQEDCLPADVVIYATGFDTMEQWVAELCGPDIARRIGRTWGLGFGQRPAKDPGPWQGELRNMWKPTAVEGLWFHGGNLAQARHYSRFLALQLAARYTGLETRVYGIPEPTPMAIYEG